MNAPPEACPDCGYDRRGIGPERACPECGASPPTAVDIDAPLDRAPAGVIEAAMLQQGLALGAHLGTACLVVVVLAGAGPGAVLLIVGGASTAAVIWCRTSPRLRPPRRSATAIGMLLRRGGPMAAVLLLLLCGAGGGNATATALASVGATILWLLAVSAAWQGGSLSAWSRDDRAGGIADLAVVAAGLTVLIFAGLHGLRLLGSVVDVPILDVDGLGRAAGVAGRLGMLTWWVLQTIADVLLLVSVVLCRMHRIEHDGVAERRRDRESAWRDEIDDRFDDAPRRGA